MQIKSTEQIILKKETAIDHIKMINLFLSR